MKITIFFTVSFLMASLVGFSQNECSLNDAFTQACPITLTNLTGSVNGSIYPDNDVDYYYFVIPRSGVITYSITNTPSNISITAYLYNESNLTTSLSLKSGGVGTSVTGIQKVCPAGKYYIKVLDSRTGTNQNTSLYNLRITLDTSDINECNESFIACTPVSLNQDIKGAINSDGDVDFYCFNIPRSGVITYSITNVPADIAITSYLYHESNQSTSLLIKSEGVGTSVTGIQKVCSTGKYYIKLLDSRSGTYLNSSLYNLRITLDTSDIYECNESFIACTPVSLNQDIKGAINSDGDVDFYCFNIPRSGVISYSITNVPANIAITSYLYHESNQSTSLLIKSGGVGTSVTGIQKICSTGKYYIKILDSRSGTYLSPILYNLKISLDTTDIYECNDDFLSSTSINCNTPIFASINFDDDKDCYKFTLTRSDIVTINVTNVPSNLDPTITLHGPAPATTELKRVTGSTGQSITLSSTTILQSGTYYVCITDTKSNAAQYQLKVTCPSVTGINDMSIDKDVIISPNPTNEIINIEISGFTKNEYAYEINNQFGRLILSKPINNSIEKVDVSKLPQGYYFITIKSKEKQTVKRFIKM